MMKQGRIFLSVIIFLLGTFSANAQSDSGEVYRPKIHYTPEAHWMNDPNGMVYYKGVYHLFYQHHPYSAVWGPMHWGQATSKDLIHWEHQPIALYPDTLGMIFSGSVVVDINNTVGFAKKGQTALVAVYTQHDEKGMKAGRNDYQNQSIAFSLDDGKTWTKYAGNPVLRSPYIRDFRDPKVMWHQNTKRWVMTLAVHDRIMFYSSLDLKTWRRESEFGAAIGAHGGVWECPDLFPLEFDGKNIWVLIVSINPGGPNKGSATQYFLGDFDGKIFHPVDTAIRWLDYGPDNYAGVTWSNMGSRKVFLGWMSNWDYANVVPTEAWRSAMTIPRELKLKRIANKMLISSLPVKELTSIKSNARAINSIALRKPFDLNKRIDIAGFPCWMKLDINKADEFSIALSNGEGDELLIGFDKGKNEYYIDRSKSGLTGFYKHFAGKHSAPRIAKRQAMDLQLVIDVSSVELFADGGLTAMTSIFFPKSPFTRIVIQSSSGTFIDKLEYSRLKPAF